MELHSLSFSTVIIWVIFYFCVMFFYTALNVAIWRKVFPTYASVLNTITMIICILFFVKSVEAKSQYQVSLFTNINMIGIILAIACALVSILCLDHFLDPLLERAFPSSEESYQKSLVTLKKTPISSFVQICLLAPFIEEILIRGFVFGGLITTYGTFIALLISAILFALLHFNMVQTLSAFISGILLGLLYLYTGSILMSILAHSLYNFISFVQMMKADKRQDEVLE